MGVYSVFSKAVCGLLWRGEFAGWVVIGVSRQRGLARSNVAGRDGEYFTRRGRADPTRGPMACFNATYVKRDGFGENPNGGQGAILGNGRRVVETPM